MACLYTKGFLGVKQKQRKIEFLAAMDYMKIHSSTDLLIRGKLGPGCFPSKRCVCKTRDHGSVSVCEEGGAQLSGGCG
jgi:hypothetical protein